LEKHVRHYKDTQAESIATTSRPKNSVLLFFDQEVAVYWLYEEEAG
jgi:hypothetical protein